MTYKIPALGPNSYPGWGQNYIPSPSEWDAWWSQKIDQAALDAAVASMQEAFTKAFSPDWQTWTPAMLFGGSNAGQENSGQTGGYRVTGNHCEWWCTFRLIAPGTSTGVMTMTGLPETAVGGTLFKADVVSVTGIASGVLPVTAVLSGNIVTFYKGQNAGDPAQMVTSADIENAMAISLQGYFQIEDE